MALTVATNVGALNAQAAASSVNKNMEIAMERLSTGNRVNSAADDAAGVAIASRMESNIRGLDQAVRNASDAQGLVNTAEGAQVEALNILQRMRELAVQSVNDTNSVDDRLALNNEIIQLRAELDRIANTTTWAGIKLLDGSFATKTFQIGAAAGQTLVVSQDDLRAAAIGENRIDTTAHAATAANSATHTLTSTGFTVLGKDGSAAATVTATGSAKALAAAVNTDTSSTGVKASAHTAVKMTIGADPATTTTFSLNGGGTAVSISASVTDADDLTALLVAINTYSGTTGVTAEFDGTNKAALILREADGDSITIENFTSSTSAPAAIAATITSQSNFEGTSFSGTTTLTSAGTDSSIFTGVARLSSTKSFVVSGGTATTGYLGANTSAASSLSKVSNVTVASRSGAESAIAVLDGAIQMINDSRASLGAISNRLDSTISNLTNVSNETTASRGRIMDADFAHETTVLSRSQILQQASTAMLAQANASKQNVLSLLQG